MARRKRDRLVLKRAAARRAARVLSGAFCAWMDAGQGRRVEERLKVQADLEVGGLGVEGGGEAGAGAEGVAGGWIEGLRVEQSLKVQADVEVGGGLWGVGRG